MRLAPVALAFVVLALLPLSPSFAQTAAVPAPSTQPVPQPADQATLQKQIEELVKQMQAVASEEGPLREEMKKATASFHKPELLLDPQDEEGSNLVKRITGLESELKQARDQLQKKVEATDAFKQRAAKIDALRARLDEIGKKRLEIMSARTQIMKQLAELRAQQAPKPTPQK